MTLSPQKGKPPSIPPRGEEWMTLSPHKGKPPSIPPKGGGMDDPQPPQGAEGWLMGAYRAYGTYRAYRSYKPYRRALRLPYLGEG